MDATAVTQSVESPGWRPPTSFRDARLHMIGIGGSGMSGLAAVLLRRGARVSGADRQASDALARLSNGGATVGTAETADAVPAETELVVRSAAIKSEHPQIVEARRRGIPVIKYAELLGALMSQHDGVAVAGTHGKSTTTAWLTYVLREAGLDPSFVIGAEVEQLGGGSGVGDGAHFVAEACEYDRSFLKLRPKSAAVLNIEEDHLDCYENIAAINNAFQGFCRLAPKDGLVVLNGQDANCAAISRGLAAEVETFGLDAKNTWRATELTVRNGRYEFNVIYRGENLGRTHAGVAGKHNVMNALAVCALATRAGVTWKQVDAGLRSFTGAKRRLQVRGSFGGVTVVDDYAHHPTEIRATLRAARELFEPRELWCVFQPHQHSRTRFLLSDFARSFEHANHIIVPQIYFVRDSERERQAVCANDLVERVCEAGGDAVHIPDFKTIVDTLVDSIKPGDLVMTMGAGDVWKAADELVRRLQTIRPD